MVSGELKPLSWEIMLGGGDAWSEGWRFVEFPNKNEAKGCGKTTSQLQGDRSLGREPEAGSYILTICF